MVLASKLIDTNALLNVLWVSFVAAVGSTAVFSIAIAGATRFFDMRREGRSVEAGFYASLAGLALAACLGAMALGIYVIVNK
jgi:hypothetical protein